MLELKEFLNFTTVMLLEFDEVSPTWLEEMIPSIAQYDKYHQAREIVSSSTFDYFVDIIILVNAIVVIAQSFPELAGLDVVENYKAHDGQIDTPWEVAETIFTFLYTVEMLSKILLLGWKQYSSSVRNLFDGFITVMAVGATIIVYYPNDYDNSNLIRFVVMARVIRVFRLFMVIKSFKVMSRTFIGVLPAAARISLLLFCVVYTFSAIGMQWFGGRFTRDPDNPLSYVLEGTDFANAFFWANNFNDLLSGMNVCFNLLVINNWNEMETGLIAISSKYCRYYFFSFFVVGVIIANNLVVAVVIDFFVKELEEEKEEATKRGTNCGLKTLEGRTIIFDGDRLPDGRKKGQYYARFRPGLSGEQQHKMLNKLIP